MSQAALWQMDQPTEWQPYFCVTTECLSDLLKALHWGTDPHNHLA